MAWWISEWICGFANAQGGRIYIGVNDQKEVIGLSDAKRLLEDIPNKIVNYLGIVEDVNLLMEGDKEYIEIVVSPSNMPIAYKGTYHYRSGSTKQELKGLALQQFIMERWVIHGMIFLLWCYSWWHRPQCDWLFCNVVSRQVVWMNQRPIRRPKMYCVILACLPRKVNWKCCHLAFRKACWSVLPICGIQDRTFHTDESDLIIQDVIEGNLIQWQVEWWKYSEPSICFRLFTMRDCSA